LNHIVNYFLCEHLNLLSESDVAFYPFVNCEFDFFAVGT